MAGEGGEAPTSEASASAEEHQKRLQAARRVAAEARRGRPQLNGAQRSSKDNENFVSDFLAASRLHFIGSWKERYYALLDALPPPPPLPPVQPGESRTFLHIDMDCFFASVAARGRPELSGLPLAVSWSDSSHGSSEIASANYCARRAGVRNGMWLRRARELCPDLISMPYEFDAYAAAAEAMYKAVLDATPHVMGVSIDECYADVSGMGDPTAIASQLRACIFERTGCYASIGIGPSRLLARLATRLAKPDRGAGVASLTAQQAAPLLRDAELASFPGVGPALRAKLLALGAATGADLAALPPPRLAAAVGAASARRLSLLLAGRDATAWAPRPPRLSVGAQASWGVRFASDAQAAAFAARLAHEVAAKLRGARLTCLSLTLKLWRALGGAPAALSKGSLGHGACETLCRTASLRAPTASGAALAAELQAMLAALRVPPAELRGMGVSAARLGGEARAARRGGTPAARVARAPPRGEYSPSKLPRAWQPFAAPGRPPLPAAAPHAHASSCSPSPPASPRQLPSPSPPRPPSPHTPSPLPPPSPPASPLPSPFASPALSPAALLEELADSLRLHFIEALLSPAATAAEADGRFSSLRALLRESVALLAAAPPAAGSLAPRRAARALLLRARALGVSTLNLAAARVGEGGALALRSVAWLGACDEAAAACGLEGGGEGS
ncbi:hypothetical protein AB1Y20_004662 [Prymnesium parvum]|uniref:UmuC domain-containing protein n=1 Tax=Prymnesium parvum TaxID=97485 RepID=A0AB34IZW5_PRYPA